MVVITSYIVGQREYILLMIGKNAGKGSLLASSGEVALIDSVVHNCVGSNALG
jgi:hypothetical protein